MESPHSAYSRRLLENQARIARGQLWDRRLGYTKVVIFLVSAAFAVALLHHPMRLLFLLIPAALFVILAVVHEKVLRWLRERRRVSQFYERGLARLEDRWMGTGEPGDRFLDPAHPYARDLDLFGEGSLFELLCTAQTHAGEETVARWLLHAASPGEVSERQGAMIELRDQLSLRERLFIAGGHLRDEVDPEALGAWGASPATLPTRWLPPLLVLLGTAWVAAAGWWFTTGSWYPLLAISVLNLGVNHKVAPRSNETAEAAEQAAADLRVVAEVLAILEGETFAAPYLQTLRASLNTHHLPPSSALKKLRRIVEWLEARENLMIRPFAPVLFYTALLAAAAERWKHEFGPAIQTWLAAVGHFEALAALAGYAWEHPGDVLPEFVSQSPCFEAENLAHPLLPEAQAVGNDLALGRQLQLVMISGPNMAGKSTLLRGVGVNAVLAQCGAPVRARRLRMSPLVVGASICVLDSLQGGVSRFYAEIRRLKLLSDLASGPVPLLFLLDELLSGTNSHDRLDGTRLVVDALVRRGAIGMVTTHDLALTAIPESMSGIARNCHFEDSIEDDRLVFDYRLKDGVVRTSNALKLMQAVGLRVGD